jgi:O-antigen ligase
MKLPVIICVTLYLFSLAFGVFMTAFFRIPAPLIFCFPLIFIFKQQGETSFLYARELLWIGIAVFLYSVIGLADFNGFAANMICILLCALYFNYFVGDNLQRLKLSIWIFFALLTFSGIVMVLNHYYGEIDGLRALLMGDEVVQSPSGIALTQFTFGYQMAALCSFAFIFVCVYKKHFLLVLLVLMACLLFLFLGMQRSAFVTFTLVVFLFMLLNYRIKAVISIGMILLASLLFFNYVLKDNLGGAENILTKNEHNDASNDRSGLAMENLRIYTEYPFGLIFYGKNWGDVIYRDYVFSSGITSHNAYLMFFTYLGPFAGIGLLLAIYYKPIQLFLGAVRFIRKKENALMICLCFSFIGICLNALSHNPWLLSADGPTVFLYFSILQLHHIQTREVAEDAVLNPYIYA